MKEDKILNSVITKYTQRAELGYKKYGHTMDRNDLTFEEWIQHAQEEAMDFTLYLEKLQAIFDEELNARLKIKNEVIRQLTLMIQQLEEENKELKSVEYYKGKRLII